MSHDRYIDFEESRWEQLAEKFIRKHRKEWDDFVYDEYNDQAIPEPPDRMEDE